MTDDATAGPTPQRPPETFFRWPPPGLERLQGDLWRAAARGALAGGFLVLPLLFVLSRSRSFASLGPFADAWWVTVVLAIVGLGFAMDALGSLKRILSRAAEALERGYDLTTVLYVLADNRRDMGFLLHGGRHFGEMDARERGAVARLRVTAALAFATGGVWMTGALGLLLLAGARGLAGPDALLIGTLGPTAVLYALGAVCATLEDGRVRRARRAWFSQPWAEDLVGEEIQAWRSALAGVAGDEIAGRVDPRRAPLLRRAGWAAVAIGVLVAVPVFTLVPASAIGPILVSVAVPGFGRIQERAAHVEAYRGLRLPSDPSVTPEDAGAALQTLLYAGTDRPPAEGEREPPRRIAEPWIPESGAENPVGAEPHRWEQAIFAAVAEQPSAELRAYLDRIAAHPGHADFAWLARAEHIDVAAGRWMNPLPPGLSMASVPIPRFGRLREAAWAHLALAARAMSEGRLDAAEEAIREVISVGLLLGDEGPTLIDNLIGYTLANTGGRALTHFYEVTAQDGKLDQLTLLRQAAERAAERVDPTEDRSVEGAVRSLAAVVENPSAVRGLRWEAYILMNTFSPCLNLKGMVYGPDEEYEDFVSRAHEALVQRPSEEGLFRLARTGYLGAGGGEITLLGRVLGLSMRSGPGTCGDVMARIQSLGSAF